MKSSDYPVWTDRVFEVAAQLRDDYVKNAVYEARSNYERTVGLLGRSCESPIEVLFLAAMIPHVLRSYYRIYPQAQVQEKRVDFLITFLEGEGDYERRIVVECDGHDYHERTAEQAEHDKSRDRNITAQGIPVFRFTGRELHRDPDACAEEVVAFTQNHLGHRPEDV
jgi:very-short-patch-repair endonuclease